MKMIRNESRLKLLNYNVVSMKFLRIMNYSVVLIVISCLLVSFCLAEEIHNLNGLFTNPKILMFAPVPVQYVIDNVNYWADSLSIDGFIIGNVCTWYSTQTELEEKTVIIAEFNRICKEHSIKYNFLKIALGYREFPIWTDSLKIQLQLEKFAFIADWAKKVGFYGIAFDTEPYTVSLWNPDDERFKLIPEKELTDDIYEFSKKLSYAIISNYRDCSVIILPEGEYFEQKKFDKGYSLWNYFFEGLNGGDLSEIIVGCEMTYKITNPAKIEKYNSELLEAFNSDYWEKGKLVKNIKFTFGSWPLGFYKNVKIPSTGKRIFLNKNLKKMKNSYGDKSPNYTPEEFETQLEEFRKYSPEWIWIYAHGASWWQLDTLKYENIWNPENQSLPVCEDFQEYIKILSDIYE